MKFKLHAIAAVAILASGAASAAMNTMADQDSSLALIAYDRTGSATGSFMADLNFNLSTFLPTSVAAGQTIQWNFNANTITVNGVLQTGSSIAYSSEFAAYAAATQVGEIRWGVIAGDSNTQRFLTHRRSVGRQPGGYGHQQPVERQHRQHGERRRPVPDQQCRRVGHAPVGRRRRELLRCPPRRRTAPRTALAAWARTATGTTR